MNHDSVSNRTLTQVAALALVCGLGAYGYIVVNSVPCYFDDAYMFIRYANNLLAGYGHVWNRGEEQVYGSTSLLHVAVVTALKACLPWLSNARLLLVASALPAFFLLAALVATSARLAWHPLLAGNYVLWGGLLVPALVLQEPFKYHLRSGMDTMLAALSNALVIFFAMRVARRGNLRGLVPLVVVCYSTYLARPDNGVYATLFPALCILLLGTGDRRRVLLTFTVAMVVILLADLVAKRLVFGTALPLGFYAKQHGVYEGYAGVSIWNPVVLMRTFFWIAMPFVCLIVFFFQRRMLRTLAAFLVPVGLTFAYYFSVNQIMGFEARFYYPSLPFFVVSAALLVDRWFLDHAPERTIGQRELLLRLVVLLLVVFAGRQVTYTTYLFYDRLFEQEPAAPSDRAYEVAAEEDLPNRKGQVYTDAIARIAREAPPGTKLALSEYGQIGAAAPDTTLIDLVGLHDKEFALNGFSAEELFEREPDLIWFPHYHYTQMLRDILESDEFWQRYLYYPDAFGFGLAIRKGSPHFEKLFALIEERWAAIYGDRKMEDNLARPIALDLKNQGSSSRSSNTDVDDG